MINIDVNDGKDLLFSIDVTSISAFNRRKKNIEELLQSYIFEMKSPAVLNEMKQKIQIILDSDVKNQRREKLNRISKEYNLPIYKNSTKYVDISFIVTKCEQF
jgi:hypothetical protein